MNIIVGLAFLVIGILISLTGILLAVRQALGPQRALFSGRSFKGIEGIINAAKALLEASKGVPSSILLLLIGLAFMVIGTIILASRPIPEQLSLNHSMFWLLNIYSLAV